MVIVLVSHWMACGWFAAALWYDFDENTCVAAGARVQASHGT
jgi:hypothetical protein